MSASKIMVALGVVVAIALHSVPGHAADTRPTIGLVLSGGGARGAAHVGVIKVLEELRIPVDFVAGTSMGAIVGGLYASGMNADELETLFVTIDWSLLLADRPAREKRSYRRKSDDSGFLVDFELGFRDGSILFPAGFIQGQNLEIALRRLTLPVSSIDDFDALPIPFRAVATDIVSGEAVALDSGDLTSSMRASMSAPGIFRPVKADERILVDGGIVNNLPVQVAQEMGADILIVVDVGFPLMREDELTSALGVAKQMLTILINGRARDQIEKMAATDILVSPNLNGIASQDFHLLAQGVGRGVDAAREQTRSLGELSVSPTEYLAYRERIEAKRLEPPTIDEIIVNNQSRLSPNVIRARLKDQTGTQLDVAQLETDLVEIYGFDTFETVGYRIVEDDDEHALLISATEKSWGPSYVRFGVNLEDNFDGSSNYNVAARLTRAEVNALGGEFRAELQMGSTPRVFAEFFQPLDYASRWYVNPQIEWSRSQSGVFDLDGLQRAELESKDLQLALLGGRQFGNWGTFNVGLSTVFSDGSLRIGEPFFDGGLTRVSSVVADFDYDTLNRVSVPTEGASVSFDWVGAREGLGSDFTVDVMTLNVVKPQTWGPNTLLHWWSLGSTTSNTSLGLTPFSLGGLFSLSGFAPGELEGRHIGLGRLLYYRNIGNPIASGFNTRLYVGASFEMGNVWQDANVISWGNSRKAGSVFFVVDSLIGPLYLGYGAAQGGRRSLYLFLGQTF